MANGVDPANDIFVSYAHVDDEPLPGVEQGWVRTFVAAFRTYLAQELGRRESVRLWMDYELRCTPARPRPETQAPPEPAKPLGDAIPTAGHCWLAVPLTRGKLALYDLGQAPWPKP